MPVFPITPLLYFTLRCYCFYLPFVSCGLNLRATRHGTMPFSSQNVGLAAAAAFAPGDACILPLFTSFVELLPTTGRYRRLLAPCRFLFWRRTAYLPGWA